MKRTRSHPSVSSSSQEQKSINAINAKYTYKDIYEFHHTVLNVLEFCDLSGLAQSELRNISHFTHIILQLLESSEVSQIVINYAQLDFSKAQHQNIEDKPASDKFLHYLLKWIAQLLQKRELTLEIVLDHYYHHFPFLKDPNPINGHFIVADNQLTQHTELANSNSIPNYETILNNPTQLIPRKTYARSIN